MSGVRPRTGVLRVPMKKTPVDFHTNREWITERLEMGFLRLFVLFLVLVGCTDGTPEWGGRVIDEGGVRRVENPQEPLGVGVVRKSLRWSTSGPDGADYWESPNKVHVFGDLVFLVDRRASRIHVVAPGGVVRPSFGEPGEGPGQYGRIVDLIPTGAGLFLVDGGNGRVEILGDSREITASYPLNQVVFSAVAAGERAIALFGILGSEPGWTRLDAAGHREPIVLPDFEVREGSSAPSSAVFSWGEKLVRLRYTTPQIRVYLANGELTQQIEIPLEVEEATDEEIEEEVHQVTSVLARDGLPSGVIRQQADRVRSLPREKLRFRKVVFDDEAGLAAIWEQNPEDFGSGNAVLHVLSIEGVYLDALEIDVPWADFAMKKGVVYALSRDPDTDLVTLTAHELLVPPELMEKAQRLSNGGR